MESLSNENRSRLTEIFSQAEHALLNSDYWNITKNLKITDYPSCRVDLRQNEYGGDEFLRDSRFLYLVQQLNGDTGPRVKVRFSIEIGSLLGTDELKGLTENLDEAYEIAKRGFLAADETDLLWQTAEAVMAHSKNGVIGRDRGEKLEHAFQSVLERGSVTTFKRLARTALDGTEIELASYMIEGSMEHLHFADIARPLLRIALHSKEQHMQTVLEITRNNKVETFSEIADPIERLAANAQEKNVVRNEDGKIMMVSGTIWEQQGVIEAQRVMGLRRFRPEVLDMFESYFAELFTQKI